METHFFLMFNVAVLSIVVNKNDLKNICTGTFP